MKKLVSIAICIVMCIMCTFNCFATTFNSVGVSESKDIIVMFKEADGEKPYYADAENGVYNVVVDGGMKITVAVSDSTKQLLVVQVTKKDSEAAKWIADKLKGAKIDGNYSAYYICLVDAEGNAYALLDGTAIAMTTDKQYVAGISAEGKVTKLNHRYDNKVITFNSNSSSFYVLFTDAKHQHSYNYTVTVAPTLNTEGVKTGVCDCGDTITKTMDKLIPVDNTTGTATVTDKVAQNAIADAKESKSDEVVIDLTTGGNVADGNTEATAAIMAIDILDDVADTKKDLTVKTNNGSVTLDQKAIKTIINNSPADGKVKIEIIETEPKDATENDGFTKEQLDTLNGLGSNVAVVAAMYINDVPVNDFNGGKATVAIPFDAKDTDKIEDYTLVSINEQGEIEKLEVAYNNGAFVCALKPFAKYAVVKKSALDSYAPDKKPEGTQTPDPNKKPGADTGDNSNLSLWLAIMIVAACTATGLIIIKKKKN